MKKIYQIPAVAITNIELQQMIAASGDEQIGIGGPYDGESPIESRRRSSLWDDEDDAEDF